MVTAAVAALPVAALPAPMAQTDERQLAATFITLDQPNNPPPEEPEEPEEPDDGEPGFFDTFFFQPKSNPLMDWTGLATQSDCIAAVYTKKLQYMLRKPL